jgi:hypothetical protein
MQYCPQPVLSLQVKQLVEPNFSPSTFCCLASPPLLPISTYFQSAMQDELFGDDDDDDEDELLQELEQDLQKKAAL